MHSASVQRLSYADSAWIALAVVLAALPHVMRTPWWVTSLAAAFIAWHLYIARLRLAFPGPWVTAVMVVGASAAVYLQFRTIFGRDPGIALLIIMLALKLLEMQTRRDATLLLALGFFLVLTNFLFSQTIPTGLYLLGCVWLITTSMTRLHQRPAASNQKLALRTAGILLAQSVPLMVLLFVLFPRVQGPLWGMPSDAHTGLSGLSDTMTPGSMSNLILSDDIAFRAEFRSRVPQQQHLYWRGPVLSEFDGRTWKAGWARERSSTQLRFDAENQPLDYEVTLEPHNKRWLFALDLPGRVPPSAAATMDFQLLARTPVTGRMRYDMVSYLDYRMGLDEQAHVLRRALYLPPNGNPRTLAYGRALRAQFADHAEDKALIQAVLQRFREEPYVYTLAPPLLHEHPVDEFLFDTRQGFCEHYSSAFAVVMRAAGIPARVVTGYQGGELNPVGGYLIVRQADAHAWTEVWLRGEGWVRIDPTAAVSPARVQRGIGAAVDATSSLPFLVRTDFEFVRRLHLGWDTVAHHWNQWVLGYNPARQRYVASQLGLGTSWRGLALGLAAGAGIITLALAIVMLRGRVRPPDDPVERAYRRFCALLGKAGLPRAPHEGPLDYGSRVAAARPLAASEALEFVTLYSELRYGPGRTEAALARLADAVSRVRQSVSRGRGVM
jgi:transglutaminase-like putative cysteine protease